MSHWLYKNQPVTEIPSGVFGFVYQITGPDGKYIGRKYVTKSVRKAVKKKDGTRSVKKKKVVSESDWKSYTGSCIPLNKDIVKYGKESFKFDILCWCNTKGQTNFAEVVCQIKSDVLIDPSYYNDAVGSGQFRGVKFDDQFIETLKGIDL